MKFLPDDLFPETLLVSHDGERALTNTLLVATRFNKKHKNVLRTIAKLMQTHQNAIANRPNFWPIAEFSRLNFEPRDDDNRRNFAPIGLIFDEHFIADSYVDARGKTQPYFQLTEEAFALLAVSFTGEQAWLWKLDFLAAFVRMKKTIEVLRARDTQALYFLRPRWQPIKENPGLPRTALVALTGHKSANSITACRRRMREAGLIDQGAPPTSILRGHNDHAEPNGGHRKIAESSVT